jgi:hypothetical protein
MLDENIETASLHDIKNVLWIYFNVNLSHVEVNIKYALIFTFFQTLYKTREKVEMEVYLNYALI